MLLANAAGPALDSSHDSHRIVRGWLGEPTTRKWQHASKFSEEPDLPGLPKARS
jgi:hypothetical protein